VCVGGGGRADILCYKEEALFGHRFGTSVSQPF